MSEANQDQTSNKDIALDTIDAISNAQSQALGSVGSKSGKVTGGIVSVATSAVLGIVDVATSKDSYEKSAEAFGSVVGGVIGGFISSAIGLFTGNPIALGLVGWGGVELGSEIGGKIAAEEAKNPQNPLGFDEVNQMFSGRYGSNSDNQDNNDNNQGYNGLQHDLGRDGHGNDDTSQNPQTPASDAEAYGGGEYGGGGGSNDEGSSGLQHDLGSDGHGNDDTSENPGSTPASDATQYGGGEYGGGGSGKPIVLDLDGDGVELVALDDSTAFYDINGDGYRERMAWASADDGFLAYDKDGDGTISAHDELSFMSYVEGAQTDLEGLAHFDTNDDGVLDADDAEWSRFRVWQDLDQDGESDAGELRTMAEAGITSISLTSDGVEQTVAGNTVFGEGSYTDGEGSQSFFDVALQHSGWGIREDADGNITVGSGDDAVLHIAGATTEPERRLDASVLGVAGIIGHDTADHLTAAGGGQPAGGRGPCGFAIASVIHPPCVRAGQNCWVSRIDIANA